MENYLMYVLVAALTIASPGPGVILATSAVAFTAVKLIGAAYLINGLIKLNIKIRN